MQPRRSIPSSVPALPTRVEAAKILAAHAKPAKYSDIRAQLTEGVTHADAELRPLQEAVVAFSRAGEVPSSPPALAFAAAAEKMTEMRWPTDSLARVWCAVGGPMFALDAKLATLELAVRAEYTGGKHVSWLERTTLDDANKELRIGSWAALRGVVVATDDATYATLVERAAAVRAKASLLRRIAIAYAFPDEPWAEEELVAYLATMVPGTPGEGLPLSLLSARLEKATIAAFIEKLRWFQNVVDYADEIVATLGAGAAADILLPLLDRGIKAKARFTKTNLKKLGAVLAAVRTDAVARAFARLLTQPTLGPIAVKFFRDAPEHAHLLDDVAGGGSKAADVARRLTEDDHAAVTEASAADLPPILVAPPWKEKKRKAGAAPVEGLAILDDEPVRIELDPEAARAAIAAYDTRPWRPATPDEIAQQRANPHYVEMMARWANGAFEYIQMPDELVLEIWNERTIGYLAHGVTYLFARYGAKAIPGALARSPLHAHGYDNTEHLGALLAVGSPRVAPIMADVLARRKKLRKIAHAWLGAHPREAALGLVPAAVGPEGKGREDARAALRAAAHLESGNDRVIREAASRYGEAARAAVDELLDADPLTIVPRTVPKLPAFLDPSNLPPVLTTSGTALPASARDNLLAMLRFSPLAPPYPGIALVRDACDAASVAAFASALVSEWTMAGAHGRDEWMLFALAHFGDDDGVRKLATWVREWGRKDGAKASRAAIVLAAIGSDVALLHLGALADGARIESVRTQAKQLLAEVADARDLTPDELSDRAVPDLDLDPDGTMTLSFGERTFRVVLDEQLRPIVVDAEGSKATSLPRGTKKDDAAKVKAAQARFKALKDDAASLAAHQVRRLETAMVAGRTWDKPTFDALFVKHPLVTHLARRLVWEVAGTRATFRVAEDGTFADADDAPFTLPDGDDVRVRIAHPLAIDDALRARWSQVFADYLLVQPFEQLGRTIVLPSEADRTATKLGRVAGVKVPAGVLLGSLEHRGWRRVADMTVAAFSRSWPGGFEATLAISPGIPLDDVSNAPIQEMGELRLSKAGREAPFGTIDPVAFSEIVRDLESLRR